MTASGAQMLDPHYAPTEPPSRKATLLQCLGRARRLLARLSAGTPEHEAMQRRVALLRAAFMGA